MSKVYPSVNETNDHDIEIQPIPFWIKAGGTVLILAIVLVGFYIANQIESSDNPADKSLAILENSLQQAKPVPARIENSTNSLETELKEEDENQAWLLSQSNLKQIESLENQLAQSQQTADTSQQQIKQLNTNVQDLTGQVEALQQSILQLQTQAKQRKVTVRTKKRPKVKPSIPFTLVSIDTWGDQLNAVIRYQGQILTLRQGAKLQDWAIVSIDREGESVTLRSTQGQTSTLKVNP